MSGIEPKEQLVSEKELKSVLELWIFQSLQKPSISESQTVIIGSLEATMREASRGASPRAKKR